MPFGKNKSSWNKGKKLSLEHRHNLSIAHIGQRSWNKGSDKRIIKKCIICNQDFKTYKIEKKFCSRKCWALDRIGKPSGMLGKHQTEKQKRIMSLIGSANKGKNNGNWMGGFRTSNPSEYLKQWNHNKGISKKYNHGLSHTKEYRCCERQKRRALQKGGGDLNVKTIQLVYEDNIKYFGTLTCIYCFNPILFGQDTLEHKQPLSRNGTNEYNNLAIACKRCNSSKRNKTEEEYRKYQKEVLFS